MKAVGIFVRLFIILIILAAILVGIYLATSFLVYSSNLRASCLIWIFSSSLLPTSKLIMSEHFSWPLLRFKMCMGCLHEIIGPLPDIGIPGQSWLNSANAVKPFVGTLVRGFIFFVFSITLSNLTRDAFLGFIEQIWI